MKVVRVVTVVLGLLLVVATGCGSMETSETGDPLQQASQGITGGTWENPDVPGNALVFRPNGTGQSYIADRDVTADITWSMELRDEQVVLSWSYVVLSSEEAQEWIVEIDGDTMRVWPQKGSDVVLDPAADEPFILERSL